MLVIAFLNNSFVELPNKVTPATAAKATNVNIKAYSTIPCPSSFFINQLIFVFISTSYKINSEIKAVIYPIIIKGANGSIVDRYIFLRAIPVKINISNETAIIPTAVTIKG